MKIILVGYGGMGRLWLEYLARYSAWQVAGLVDVNEEALRRAQTEFGITGDACFKDFRSCVEKVAADATAVVTPAPLHKDFMLAALSAGMHVITEKPAVTRWEDALAVHERARETGRLVMVSQNYRYYPSSRALKRFIESGEPGRVSFAGVRFQRGSGQVAGPHKKPYSQDIFLMEMAIHHFDTMRAVFGRDPVRVFAHSWEPAWSSWGSNANAIALFEFEDDLPVNYFGAWATHIMETEFPGTWTIDCEKGTLTWDGFTVKYHQPDKEARVICDRSETPTVRAQRVLDGSLAEFTKAVQDRREPETSIRDNLKTLAMCFAAIESSRRRAPVEISEFV